MMFYLVLLYFHFGATNYYLWMFFKMWLHLNPECYSVLHVIIHPLTATIHLRGVNIGHVVYTLWGVVFKAYGVHLFGCKYTPLF